MENELVKKLTSKNNRDFELAALQIINNSDVEAFKSLVEKSDFLFDFVKSNVIKRLSKVIDENNYKNLFKFLKIYSPDYEELIISSFVKYANEESISTIPTIFAFIESFFILPLNKVS